MTEVFSYATRIKAVPEKEERERERKRKRRRGQQQQSGEVSVKRAATMHVL
jgi:hypothetical protein